MKLDFHKKTSYRILIITGACRTGKTTLAKFLASQSNYELLDEPWLPMFLPIFIENGEISESLGKNLLNAYFDELCNDITLYRQANFRPGDQSSIWNYKSAEEIFKRLVSVNSREDVKNWVSDNNTTFIIPLPETTPFIKLFLQAFANISIVFLSRSQNTIASLIAEKEWYSDEQLLQPNNNQPYTAFVYKNTTYYMPWWLKPAQFEEFLTSSDLDRGKIYWNYFESNGNKQIDSLNEQEKKHVLKLTTEEFEYNEGLRQKIDQLVHCPTNQNSI